MTLKELQSKMPENTILLAANLKGRNNRSGFNHIYYEGRVYLTFGLVYHAEKKTVEEFHRYVMEVLTEKNSYIQDITENYREYQQEKLREFKIEL